MEDNMIIKDKIEEYINKQKRCIDYEDNYQGFINYIDIIMNNKNDKQYNDSLIDIIRDYAQAKAIIHIDDLFRWGKENISTVNDFLCNSAIHYKDIETILRESSIWNKENVLMDKSMEIVNYILYSKIASTVDMCGITEEQEEQFQNYVNDNCENQIELDLSIKDIEEFVNETLEIKNQNIIKRSI